MITNYMTHPTQNVAQKDFLSYLKMHSLLNRNIKMYALYCRKIFNYLGKNGRILNVHLKYTKSKD